jgi:hypothetical protein
LLKEKFTMVYLFRKWYKKLFKLNSRLEIKYKSFLAKINSTELICAQVRIGGKRPLVNSDLQFTSINNTRIYWNYIKMNFINKTKNDYKLFLT